MDRFTWKFWLTAVAMRMSQAFVLLSLGTACSFLRRFGWLLIGILVWAYLFVHEVVPGIAVLNVFALANPQLEGEEWIIPRRLLLVQLSLGAVLMSMAYILFWAGATSSCGAFRKLARSRVGNGFLLSGSLAVGILGISLFYQVMKDHADSDEGGTPGEVTVEYPSWSTSRARSRHYEFIYPTNMTGRALTLLAAADPVYEMVQQFFEAEKGEPVVVDATSTLPRHAGLAYWEKIRLNLAASEERSMLQSVLGHETAHIFLERLSDSRLSEQFNSTRLFHEGVATYVEYALFPAGRDVAESRRVAAVMRDRDEVHIEELTDNSLLVARRDSNLVYPLGELFVAELADRHGQAAIGKIARAMAREDAPEGLAGLELWRDVFQASGYNFDRVLDGFYRAPRSRGGTPPPVHRRRAPSPGRRGKRRRLHPGACDLESRRGVANRLPVSPEGRRLRAVLFLRHTGGRRLVPCLARRFCRRRGLVPGRRFPCRRHHHLRAVGADPGEGVRNPSCSVQRRRQRGLADGRSPNTCVTCGHTREWAKRFQATPWLSNAPQVSGSIAAFVHDRWPTATPMPRTTFPDAATSPSPIGVCAERWFCSNRGPAPVRLAVGDTIPRCFALPRLPRL